MFSFGLITGKEIEVEEMGSTLMLMTSVTTHEFDLACEELGWMQENDEISFEHIRVATTSS